MYNFYIAVNNDKICDLTVSPQRTMKSPSCFNYGSHLTGMLWPTFQWNCHFHHFYYYSTFAVTIKSINKCLYFVSKFFFRRLLKWMLEGYCPCRYVKFHHNYRGINDMLSIFVTSNHIPCLLWQMSFQEPLTRV